MAHVATASMKQPPPPAPLPHTQHTSPQSSGLAIASLILGIVSFMGLAVLIIPPVLAVIFGHISLSQIKTNPQTGGKGLGITGLVLGYLSLVGTIAWIVLIGFAAAMAASENMNIE